MSGLYGFLLHKPCGLLQVRNTQRDLADSVSGVEGEVGVRREGETGCKSASKILTFPMGNSVVIKATKIGLTSAT